MLNREAPGTRSDWPLRALLLLYLAASLLHFMHNAEHVHDYPNLPQWISRGGVYVTWLGITAVGVLGYWLYCQRRLLTGLVLLGIYAAIGLDGLLHYTRAPFEAHSAAMNFTILFEATVAATLLAALLMTASSRLATR